MSGAALFWCPTGHHHLIIVARRLFQRRWETTPQAGDRTGPPLFSVRGSGIEAAQRGTRGRGGLDEPCGGGGNSRCLARTRARLGPDSQSKQATDPLAHSPAAPWWRALPVASTRGVTAPPAPLPAPPSARGRAIAGRQGREGASRASPRAANDGAAADARYDSVSTTAIGGGVGGGEGRPRACRLLRRPANFLSVFITAEGSAGGGSRPPQQPPPPRRYRRRPEAAGGEGTRHPRPVRVATLPPSSRSSTPAPAPCRHPVAIGISRTAGGREPAATQHAAARRPGFWRQGRFLFPMLRELWQRAVTRGWYVCSG